MSWWAIVKQGKILAWPNILKKENIGNGTILLYDPRQNSAEQVMEKHYPFPNFLGSPAFHVKTLIPIKVRGVSGRNDAPSIQEHIAAMEKKLGKKLPKQIEEKMLASKDVDDFMLKAHDERIGFIYIAPVSSWREDLPKNWYDIATWQGNGYRNMITAAPIPRDYWHYDSAMNNKSGLGIWKGEVSQFHANQTDSLMTKEMARLEYERLFEEEYNLSPSNTIDRVLNHNLGSSGGIFVLMREVINKNLDSDWDSNRSWELYETSSKFKEYIDSHGGKNLL